jgi:hypothetical protein
MHEVCVVFWSPNEGGFTFDRTAVARKLVFLHGDRWREGFPTAEYDMAASIQYFQKKLPERAACFLPVCQDGSWELAVVRLENILNAPIYDTTYTQIVWNILNLCPGVAWASYGTKEVFSKGLSLIDAVGVQRTLLKKNNVVPYNTIACRIEPSTYGSEDSLAPDIDVLVQGHWQNTNKYVQTSTERWEQAIQQSDVIHWMVGAALLQTRYDIRPGPYRDMIDAIRMADTQEDLAVVAADPQWLVSPAYQPGWEMLGQRMERWCPVSAKNIQRQAETMLHHKSILRETLDESFVLGASVELGWHTRFQ